MIKRICVVGAGISGLSAAHELKKVEFDVVVYEKDDHAGGRMSTRKSNNFAFDIGADFLSENYDELKKYAEELGVPWVPTLENGKHRIIKDGCSYYLSISGAFDVFRTGILPWKSRLKLLFWLLRLGMSKSHGTFFDLSSVSPENDLMSADEYLRRKVDIGVRDYIADPFTSLMQFHLTNEISEGAMSVLLKMMITPGKGFVLRYTPGGMGRIPGILAERLGVKLNVGVSSVSRKADGQVRVVKENGEEEFFDGVVIATTATSAMKMLKEKTDFEIDFFSKVRYASTIVVALDVPRNLFSDGTHLTYVPFVENEIIGGYANEGRKGVDFVHKDSALVNVYLHEKAAKKFRDMSDSDIFRSVLSEFRKVCPEMSSYPDSAVKLHDMKRWAEAMPKFYAGYLTLVKEFLDKRQGIGGVYFAGDYLNSPWVEGSIRCGKRVAEKIKEDFANHS